MERDLCFRAWIVVTIACLCMIEGCSCFNLSSTTMKTNVSTTHTLDIFPSWAIPRSPEPSGRPQLSRIDSNQPQRERLRVGANRASSEFPKVDYSITLMVGHSESDDSESGVSDSDGLTPFLEVGNESDEIAAEDAQINEYHDRNELEFKYSERLYELRQMVVIPGVSKGTAIAFANEMKKCFKDFMQKWIDVRVDGKRLKCKVDSVFSDLRSKGWPWKWQLRCHLTCYDGERECSKDAWVDDLRPPICN